MRPPFLYGRGGCASAVVPRHLGWPTCHEAPAMSAPWFAQFAPNSVDGGSRRSSLYTVRRQPGARFGSEQCSTRMSPAFLGTSTVPGMFRDSSTVHECSAFHLGFQAHTGHSRRRRAHRRGRRPHPDRVSGANVASHGGAAGGTEQPGGGAVSVEWSLSSLTCWVESTPRSARALDRFSARARLAKRP